jgi:hypothetical protein
MTKTGRIPSPACNPFNAANASAGPLTNCRTFRHADGMRSDDLTRDQCRTLADQLRKMLGYLNRLEKRMSQQGFPLDDDLYRATVKARDAMHEVSIEAHYLGCRGSTGGRR